MVLVLVGLAAMMASVKAATWTAVFAQPRGGHRITAGSQAHVTRMAVKACSLGSGPQCVWERSGGARVTGLDPWLPSRVRAVDEVGDLSGVLRVGETQFFLDTNVGLS